MVAIKTNEYMFKTKKTFSFIVIFRRYRININFEQIPLIVGSVNISAYF